MVYDLQASTQLQASHVQSIDTISNLETNEVQ